MWQSAALAGALSLGGSVPTEFVTCWARPCPMSIPGAAAVIAAIGAPLMKVRRAIIFSSRVVLIQTNLLQLGGRAEGLLNPTKAVAVAQSKDLQAAGTALRPADANRTRSRRGIRNRRKAEPACFVADLP